LIVRTEDVRKENRQRTENEDGGVQCLTKIRIGDKKEKLKRDNKRMEGRGTRVDQSRSIRKAEKKLREK